MQTRKHRQFSAISVYSEVHEVSHECQGWCKGKDVDVSLAQGKKRDKTGTGKDQGPLLIIAVNSYISSATHKTALQRKALCWLIYSIKTCLGWSALTCFVDFMFSFAYFSQLSPALLGSPYPISLPGIQLKAPVAPQPQELSPDLLSFPLHNSVLLVNHIDRGIIR